MVEVVKADDTVEKFDDNFLVVDKLVTKFFTSKGIVNAIDGVSFNIKRGEIYGLVGESGSGKSVTASSIMDIVTDPPGRIISGDIYIDGYNILSDLNKLATIKIVKNKAIIKRKRRPQKKHDSILRNIRGRLVSIIFQEPGLSLNPILSIGEQITETILQHSIIEMSEYILARYDLTEEILEGNLKQLFQIKDKNNLRSSVRYMCRKYGIAEISSKIAAAISSNQDKIVLIKEIFNLIKSKSGKINISKIETIYDYYKAQQNLWELNAKLNSAEKEGNFDEIDNLRGKIYELKSFIKREFLFVPLKMKFAKSRYLKEYNAIAKDIALEMLELVGFAEPERTMVSYPHELSGGMQQRVMIAMALSTNPKLLIADEPTTALDVTTQAQILDLIKDLKEFIGSSILFITHDLAVIAEMCDRIGVMYAGILVEEAEVKDLFHTPKHPYTEGLLESIPKEFGEDKKIRLKTIPGNVPNLITPPGGCRFHPRCKFAMDKCSITKPKMVEISTGHKVACFLYSEESDN
ncbi:MAG: ABC transporter ATP-binding protein [Thermoplasmatales archaeon]